MAVNPEIQLVDMKESDLDLVKDIYDYYILNSTATFHTDRVSITELKEYILIGDPKYKSFIIKFGSADNIQNIRISSRVRNNSNNVYPIRISHIISR